MPDRKSHLDPVPVHLDNQPVQNDQVFVHPIFHLSNLDDLLVLHFQPVVHLDQGIVQLASPSGGYAMSIK